MTQNGSTTDEQSVQTEQQTTPNPALRCLDVLVGTWHVNGQVDGTGGEIHGQATCAWMEGGFFLIQQVDLVHDDVPVKGVEYIGYDEASKSLKSHYFDIVGNILENVWEVSDHTLTIWAGEIGSAASFKSKFSDDHNTYMGRWEWPGGGYELTLKRVS